ncbi:hypothetical protein LTR05_005759 [Lithohypha guttulata]|uniref:Probable E3 ubiquitin ligase complex SCF subunit sconB n=1 Tax=Lithohypha guttulata TaxID=1690604 RepID=A0AAN7SY98_9EURO|nr:hypothetical protein LTR05_005759 [Lithohypha guttulata]
MQQDASASLAPDRRTSLQPWNRPMTSGSPYSTTYVATTNDATLPRNRMTYHALSTYHNNEWDSTRPLEVAGTSFANEEAVYADPFSAPSDTPTYRRHARRPSLAESIRSSISSVRSLGRRMSTSMRGKGRVASEDKPEGHDVGQSTREQEHVLERPETMSSASRPLSNMIDHLRPRRRPSMPIFKSASLQSAPTKQPQRPEYHRATTINNRPECPPGGAGARASAAAQNEALYMARATPLPPYRPRSFEHDEFRDSESGIGIVLDTLDRSDSRTQHLVRQDPADILATELIDHMLSFLDASTLVQLELVSRRWRELCQSQSVWRQVFYRKYAPSRPSRVLQGQNTAGLGKNVAGQDYRKLYSVRTLIDKRWANGEAAAIYLNGHKDSVYCIQFDEDKIITGSRDNTIRIWDARTYQCIKKISPPNNQRERNPVLRPAVEPSGVIPFFKMDASSQEPKSIPANLWHHASVLCLQFDHEFLVTGSSDFTAIVWDIENNYKPRFQLVGHKAGVLDVCLDSRRIVTCSKDTTIKIWDRRTGTLVKTLTGHRGPVNAVQIRGNLLASASGDGMAKLWRLDTGMCIKEFHSRERGLACVEFSEDGRTIFAGGNDQVIFEFDTTNGNIKRELAGHEELVRSLHLDTANVRLISGSYDHSIKIWDAKSGVNQQDGGLKMNLEGWTSSWMLAAKSNYRKIACASQDGRVVIVDFGFGINGVELVEA